MTDSDLKNTYRLYRAVGFGEYASLTDGEHFQILQGGVGVKYFGKSFDETLDFADRPINDGIVAIFEVGISKNALMKIGDFANVDKFIFKSGTIEIPEERLGAFNDAVLYVKHIY